MDPERFRQSSAGRLAKAGASDAAYWSFVPHPLPPRMALDLQLIGALSAADRAVGELAGLARLLPNPHLLIHPFMRMEAVLSSRIEGTQATIADVYALEARQTPRSMRSAGAADRSDAQEVLNYIRALEHGLQWIDTLPLSLRLIRELHAQLMTGVRGQDRTPGEFRRSQNWIGAPGCTLTDATYVPPPPSELPACLGAFEAYLHAEDPHPPLLRLAFIHSQFEAIHPFPDGNGRIGRLLISLLLVHWGILASPLLYLSAFFERNRSDYYACLLAVSERGAWREWSLFFLRGIVEQAHDAVERARHLQDLHQTWRQRLTQKRASALALQLADALFDNPVLTIPAAQRRLGVTYRSAALNVQKLVQAGILHPSGRDTTHGKWFVATDILRAIGDEAINAAP